MCRVRADVPLKAVRRLGGRGRRVAGRVATGAGRARSDLSALARVRLKLHPRSRNLLRWLVRLRRHVPIHLIAVVRLDTPVQADPRNRTTRRITATARLRLG